ncbi:tyrosine-type recombinase/integrase [Nocardioides sp. J54]|uniref:tyrosine-type recombinase/integrase n=1 Tax=Nocardioides sp. J54 TaxID=935866 RepID=UPI0004B85117|nr:site-specific integrase [Nocardioides sp. J54]
MAGSARGFGRVRKLPSGRWQAFYSDPTGATRLSRSGKPTPVRHAAASTFSTKRDAEAWLGREQALIAGGTWTPPAARQAAQRAAAESANKGTPGETFGSYAARWIVERRTRQGAKPLAPRTRTKYADMLEHDLAPLAPLAIEHITPEVVSGWYDTWTPRRRRARAGDTGATQRAHAYSFGRAVMASATSAGGPLAGQMNPFSMRGAGSSPSRRREELATAEQVDVMLATIRPEWRLLLQLGLWTGLRFSEIAELRRKDVDLDRRVLRIRRAVSGDKAEPVKGPKSEAGDRDQRVPASLVADIRQHLRDHVGRSRDSLLFPSRTGGHLAPQTFYGAAPGDKRRGRASVSAGNRGWYHARTAAGHPTLHFHDLRATGATLLAQQGATEAEVQAFLGDSTPQAAQRYVRAARSRMDMLTDRLDDLATSGGW